MADDLLSRAGQKWLAVVGAVSTVVGVIGLGVSHRLWWAWIAIGSLALFAVSLYWVAREEQGKRIAAESSRREVVPPGHDSAFFPAPTDYQVNALRQAIIKFKETGATQFDNYGLNVMLKKLPRKGTDPVYEPLQLAMCIDGLDVMVESGELERTERGFYKIP